jgi:hypothetical protein
MVETAPGEATAAVTGNGVGEAERVLARLERIRTLEGSRAADAELLAELRGLVRDAEAWARLEGDARAREAASKLRERTEGMS